MSRIAASALAAATLATVASPAVAENPLVKPAASVAPAAPAVPDGDLGCVVRMMILSYDNKKVLEDPKSSPADKASAEKDLVVIDRHLAFYLGRVSQDMPKLPLDPPLNARIETVIAEPSDVSARENVICDEFARANKLSTLKTLKGQ